RSARAERIVERALSKSETQTGIIHLRPARNGTRTGTSFKDGLKPIKHVATYNTFSVRSWPIVNQKTLQPSLSPELPKHPSRLEYRPHAYVHAARDLTR